MALSTRRAPFAWGCLLASLALLALAVFTVALPAWALRTFGPPAPRWSMPQVWRLSAQLAWYAATLTRPADPAGPTVSFTVSPGEPVDRILERLHAAGLVRSPAALRVYLLYRGADTGLQVGTFPLSPAMTPIEIAAALQTPRPTEAKLGVLPGWRREEVAAALAPAGLEAISPEDFLQATARAQDYPLPFAVPADATLEGFLYPGVYRLPRTASARDVARRLVDAFAAHWDPAWEPALAARGLTPYQGLIVASIVQREAVFADEMPRIAAVFLNRLAAGMPLAADPTVQYALGWNGQTWWKVPLTAADLAVASPYNTYRQPGLPPGPICSPGRAALDAVAHPAPVADLYFRAACDGSGRHVFARTYEEHLRNACP